MNTKHTPGPWGLQTLTTKHNGYSDWPVFAIRSGGSAIGGHCLAVVGEVDRSTASGNGANARLIAAAPDLLNMLQRMVDEAASGSVCLCTQEHARNAIASATGGAQ